jgi:hypothetical protein
MRTGDSSLNFRIYLIPHMGPKSTESDPHPAPPTPFATKSDFCRYNEAFGQCVFTAAWVDYLVRHLADDATYQEVMRHRDIKLDLAF